MSRTILCVDDSVTMQKVAEITFDASDFAYQGARNADEGLAAAKANKPALILADAVMPGKTGYDLCQAVKADPSLADVPVLIMCGNSQAFDAARGDGVGADGHIVKPWDTQVMLDKVAEALEGAGGRPAVAAAPTAIPVSASTPLTRPPAPISRPLTPPPVPGPPMPSIKQPEPPRSATIMGMPSLKLPGSPGADFGAATPIVSPPPKPVTPNLTPTPPPPAPPKPAVLSMPEPVSPRSPALAPIRPAPPIAPVVAPIAPALKPTAAPQLSPSFGSAPRPAALPEMPRPPMIKGTPRRRPPSIAALDVSLASSIPELKPTPAPAPTPPPPVAAIPQALAPAPAIATPLAPAIAARTSEVVRDLSRAEGLDPNGAEVAAIAKISREVVERIVWEVVPELAEAIIREHIAKNGLQR